MASVRTVSIKRVSQTTTGACCDYSIIHSRSDSPFGQLLQCFRTNTFYFSHFIGQRLRPTFPCCSTRYKNAKRGGKNLRRAILYLPYINPAVKLYIKASFQGVNHAPSQFYYKSVWSGVGNLHAIWSCDLGVHSLLDPKTI